LALAGLMRVAIGSVGGPKVTGDALNPILSVTALLALAWWSRLQGLHWPPRALWIAFELVCFSVVSLCVLILHSTACKAQSTTGQTRRRVLVTFVSNPIGYLFSPRVPQNRQISVHKRSFFCY
jgi:hypothetical protein